MEKRPYIVSTSPHIYAGKDVRHVMADVLIALIPAAALAVYFFGIPALKVMTACVVSCVGGEWIFQKMSGKEIKTVDLSAVVTGILLAFCLPPGFPWWMAATGGVISVIIGKELFGGVGHNIFNPALIGRAVLFASWPAHMTTWSQPARTILSKSVDAISTATPLEAVKLHEGVFNLWDLFMGQVGGSLGETAAAALVLGAIYLFARRVINWRIPTAYITTVAVMSIVLGRDPLGHVLAGGLILGAFFMATDYVTSPMTKSGRLIFGAGCGILTCLIRFYGGFPEGVCYAILMMNALTPLIDNLTQPKPYGFVKE